MCSILVGRNCKDDYSSLQTMRPENKWPRQAASGCGHDNEALSSATTKLAAVMMFDTLRAHSGNGRGKVVLVGSGTETGNCHLLIHIPSPAVAISERYIARTGCNRRGPSASLGRGARLHRRLPPTTARYNYGRPAETTSASSATARLDRTGRQCGLDCEPVAGNQ